MHPSPQDLLTKERSAMGAALATAVLVWLSFPPAGLSWLSFVAWVPLFWAIETRASRSGFAGLGLGWIAGVVIASLGEGFVMPALTRVSGLSVPACVGLFVALASYEGLRWGLFGWIASRAIHRGHRPAAVLVMAFVGAEVAFPSLLPFPAGAALHGWIPLVQIADLGGATTISLVVASVNALLVAVLGRGFQSRVSRRSLLILALVPITALGYGCFRIHAVESSATTGAPLRIGLLHGTFEREPPAGSIGEQVEASRALAKQGAELVVWGESALPGPYPAADLDGALTASVTGRLGVPSLIGVTVSDDRDGIPNIFNSVVASDRNGQVEGRYDKRRLLAFGEQVPFEHRFPWLRALSPKSGAYTEGPSRPALQIEGHPVGTTICFEDILGSYVRERVRAERPELMVNLGNDGWFAGSSEAELHFLLARVRAVEHRRYFARSANLGVSAVIDPVGRVTTRVPEGDGAALITVRYASSTTLYETLGDAPWWIAGALALGMAVRARRRRPAGVEVRVPPDTDAAITSSAPS